MDETLLTPQPQTEPPPPSGLSLPGRLLNVFAAPGEVFQEVRNAPPSTANWLVPALILIAVSWLSVWQIFSQDSIKHQLSEVTDRAIQKQVERTHMSEQQAEQARAIGEKWAMISSRVAAVVAPVFAAFVTPFFWGLILWLLGAQVWKGNFPYMKAVEVAGLAGMISVLGVVVKTLLIVAMGNLYASPSLMLLVKDYDPQNLSHMLLAVVNVMTFWLLGVLALGLARLSGVALAKASLWVFGLWAAYTAFWIAVAAVGQTILKQLGPK